MVTFNNIPVQIERKAFRRSLTITLRPHQPIKVRAALLTGMNQIHEFLEQKRPWIERQISLLAKMPTPCTPQFVDGESFRLFGDNLVLRKVPTLIPQYFFKATPSELILHCPLPTWSDPLPRDVVLLAYTQYLKNQAEKWMSERLGHWAQAMQVQAKKLTIRGQKTMWGTCNSKGVITLNWKLIMAPTWVIDSVIVHELAHLRHMNHSKQFWQLVATHLPNYREARIWLRHNGTGLELR